MGRNNKVGAIPTWNWLTFVCCQPCLPNFQCFQSGVSWALLHSPLLRLSCHSLRNVSFSGLILGLIKSAHHGWLSMMTSSEGPPFWSCLGPPNPKSTTGYMVRERLGTPALDELQTTICTDCFVKCSILGDVLQVIGIESSRYWCQVSSLVHSKVLRCFWWWCYYW